MNGPTKFVPESIDQRLSKATQQSHALIVSRLAAVRDAWSKTIAECDSLRAALTKKFSHEDIDRLKKTSGTLYTLLQEELNLRQEAETWLKGYATEYNEAVYEFERRKIADAKQKVQEKIIGIGFEKSHATPELINSHPDVKAAKGPLEYILGVLGKLINPQLADSPLAINAARCQEIQMTFLEAVRQSERLSPS